MEGVLHTMGAVNVVRTIFIVPRKYISAIFIATTQEVDMQLS